MVMLQVPKQVLPVAMCGSLPVAVMHRRISSAAVQNTSTDQPNTLLSIFYTASLLLLLLLLLASATCRSVTYPQLLV
jgi:hypothetical protein